MKHLLLLAIFLLYSGCVGKYEYVGTPNYSYAPSMSFGQTVKGTWEIFTPPRGVWTTPYAKVYLPEYFSEPPLWGGNRPINFFFAKHSLDKNTNLALLVQFPDAFYNTERVIYVAKPSSINAAEFKDNSEMCLQNTTQEVSLVFNAVDVEFDNSSVYFLKNNEKIMDVKTPGSWVGGKYTRTREQTIYNLASKKLLEEKQFEHSTRQESFTYPTFYFRFPLDCADLEDAVFVIDGLYRHGKPLPPLTVKLNYLNFNKVPQKELQ